MTTQRSSSEKLMLGIITAVAWAALILQFYLIILNRTASIPETVMRYFTFFTILTNILVALCGTYILLKPGSKGGRFFSKQSTLAAIALYILVVGAVYNFILRFLWAPEGLARMVDEMLHSVVPLLFVLYWFIFARKNELQWKNTLPWLIYPSVYFIVIIIRGSFANYYPYPFVDVLQLGYPKVLINSALLTGAFFVMALVFVGIGKLSKKKQHNQA